MQAIKQRSTQVSQGLDVERLINVSLSPVMDGSGWNLAITTTHRAPTLLINSKAALQGSSLVAEANQRKGKRVVAMTISEKGQYFELILEDNFRLYLR